MHSFNLLLISEKSENKEKCYNFDLKFRNIHLKMYGKQLNQRQHFPLPEIEYFTEWRKRQWRLIGKSNIAMAIDQAKDSLSGWNVVQLFK